MAPHYSETTVEGRSQEHFRLLNDLGLDQGLWSVTYLLPEEIGSLPEKTSVLLVEPRMRSDTLDLRANCFAVNLNLETGQVECVPFCLSQRGRQLEAPGTGVRLVFGRSSQEATRLDTLEVNENFVGLLQCGFQRVLFWNPESQKYIALNRGNFNTFGESLVIAPVFYQKTTYILPLSEINSQGKGLNILKTALKTALV